MPGGGIKQRCHCAVLILGVGGAHITRYTAVLGVEVDVLNGLRNLPEVFREVLYSSWRENQILSPTSHGSVGMG